MDVVAGCEMLEQGVHALVGGCGASHVNRKVCVMAEAQMRGIVPQHGLNSDDIIIEGKPVQCCHFGPVLAVVRIRACLE